MVNAVIARTDADPGPLAAAIRGTVARLDRTVPVFQIETGDQRPRGSIR